MVESLKITVNFGQLSKCKGATLKSFGMVYNQMLPTTNQLPTRPRDHYSSLVFPDGINVLLHFRIHKIVNFGCPPPLAHHTTFYVIHC